MNTSSLIQKVWNFCHTLRHGGAAYGNFLEQPTCLLFLKMACIRAERAARASSAKAKKSTPSLTRSSPC